MQDILSDTATWAILLGIVTSLAQSIIQRPEWSSKVRVAVAVAAALVVGLVTVLAEGSFDTGNWFATAGVVLVAAQAAYGLLLKPTGVAKVVELKTTRRKRGYDYRDDLAA